MEVMNELGNAMWSALTREGGSSVYFGEVLCRHWRACEYNVHLLWKGIGEDLRRDSPGVHG